MGGKAKKRRAKNYLAAHGGNNRLPPPPNTSSIDALPSKLRKIMSFASSPPTLQGSANGSENSQRRSKKEDAAPIKPHLKSKVDCKSCETREQRVKKSADPQDTVDTDIKEDKNKKKRKRKVTIDHRFEAELEKLGVVSKRKQRKKEFLKAKKKKQKKGSIEQIEDLPKHDVVKFGDVAEAPPKLPVIPAFKKSLDASRERLRLQAIESYRNRKGWTNRPGVHLPPMTAMSASSDM